MRAVVMAGGEGTRLRPMTANLPKPLLPVVNRPIMEHVLNLLRRHGLTETVVTVQFLAALVRSYFGDGAELGMSLAYATEEKALGTAGSVKNAADALRDEPFLVISGDAITDVDLTELIQQHRKRGALVTVGLRRVPNPLEFGIVITGEDDRIERFLEKPTWGQVFSDTANTGIYVMEPEVLDHVAAGEPVDWSGDVFPALLEAGAPLYGYVFDSYWEDVGTLESYMRVQADVLNRQVDVEIDGFEISPGVWLGEGSEVHPEVVLKGPLYIGKNVRIDAGAELREFTVIGDNVVVKEGAFLHRAVVHDNCFIGPQTNLRGCVLGDNTAVLRAVRIEEGAVVGDDCVLEEEAYLAAGVKVYPSKTIEAGAHINTSVIWESRGSKALFGRRGISGLVNVEITPELAVRLASAYATTLKKGAVVTTCRDASRAARALKRTVIGALTASGIDVRDLQVAPTPLARFLTATTDAAGGVMLRTTPGDQQSIDIVFLDEHGANLSQSAQRKVERTLSRQEFRRAYPGEIGELSFPARTFDGYTAELLRRIDVTGVREAGLKVVVDTAGGAASYVLPSLLGGLDVDALTINLGIRERVTTETERERGQSLGRLRELVASSQAAFGARFDQVGERLCIVDDRGEIVEDERALLVMLDLVAAERRQGWVAVPVTATSVAEQVTRSHGVQTRRTGTATDALTRVTAAQDVAFGGDGRGGFVVPEVSATVDGLAAFVRLLGLVARARLPLSEIDARIPAAHVVRRAVRVPWAAKGAVMRAVAEAAADYRVDPTDGVRVVIDDDRWVLVLPDESEALLHVWAEGPDQDESCALLDEWAAVVEEAGR